MDRQFIKSMLEAGALGVYKSGLLDVSRGFITLCCSDGDQFDEFVDDLRDMAISAGVRPRIHTIANIGGALLASPESPFAQHIAPEGIRWQVLWSSEKKGINTIVLSVHAPCGAATEAGLHIEALVDHMMATKNVLKKAAPSLKVLCILFVDFGDGDKRNFIVTREAWDRYRRFTRFAMGQVTIPAFDGAVV
jgi:hypothetical protein